jgi:hypothetical protein
MPRYSTYGARDDRVAEDGDRGFVGLHTVPEMTVLLRMVTEVLLVLIIDFDQTS